MRFFSKRQQQNLNQYALPGDIVSKMERFGRFEFDPQGSSGEMGDFGDLMIELYSFASAEPEGFLVALAEAVLPFSGWAGYGASRTVWEVLSPGRGSPLREHAAYISIMNAAIQFLRANGVPQRTSDPMNGSIGWIVEELSTHGCRGDALLRRIWRQSLNCGQVKQDELFR